MATQVRVVGENPTTTHHAYGTDAGVVVRLAQTDRGVWNYHGVSFGYNDVPTGGRITITGGGFDNSWPITASGPGFIYPPTPEKSNMVTDVVVMMTAGGSGIRGDLNVHAELR